MSTRKYDLLIVGAGSFGTALAHILGQNNHKILMWLREEAQVNEINKQHTNEAFHPGIKLSKNIKATTDLSEGVKSAPIILMALPTKAFREVARAVGDDIHGDQILLHVAKGIERETYKRMSEILREETCALKIGVLSGPNLAAEVIKGQPSGALVASHFEEVVEKAQALFHGSTFRLYGGHDVIGAEVGGAFKNIIALMAGAAAGLDFGDNTKSLIITRGLSEMAQYGVALGADVFTFGGLAGIGDLMATCSSPLSRNHTVGRRMAQGESLDDILESMKQVAEGVPTTMAVFQQCEQMGLHLAMVHAVYDVLYKKAKPENLMLRLMERPPGQEMARLYVELLKS